MDGPDNLVVGVRPLGNPGSHLASFPARARPMVVGMLEAARQGEIFSGPVLTLCLVELTGELLIFPASPADMGNCLACRRVMRARAHPGELPVRPA